jgi:hypothetical protein
LISDFFLYFFKILFLVYFLYTAQTFIRVRLVICYMLFNIIDGVCWVDTAVRSYPQCDDVCTPKKQKRYESDAIYQDAKRDDTCTKKRRRN